MNSQTNDIETHLSQFAEMSRFWLLRTREIQPGLIHYSGADGTAYTLIDDDDKRVERCIEFLISKGCRVFDDIDEMDAYAEHVSASRS